jgi:hypothetical protein
MNASWVGTVNPSHDEPHPSRNGEGDGTGDGRAGRHAVPGRRIRDHEQEAREHEGHAEDRLDAAFMGVERCDSTLDGLLDQALFLDGWVESEGHGASGR